MLQILSKLFPALLDTGAHQNVCGMEGTKKLKDLGFKAHKLQYKQPPIISTADNTPHKITHCFHIPVHFDEMFAIIKIFSAPTLPLDIILGIPFTHSFKMGLFTPNSVWIPDDDNDQFTDYSLQILSEVDIVLESEKDQNEIESRRELSDEEDEDLKKIIEKFEELGKILLGRTNVISHDIDTGDNKPSFTGTRPTSPTKEKLIEQEFLRFRELGVIEPAQSAYRNAMTMVERYKEGKLKLRLCMDSRKLNAITKVEKYDLPRITTILGRLGKAKFMSKIDLKDAYLQIPLTERSKEKTAFFVKGHGVWQFLTMPFGLVNCSATMQRLMDTLFGDLDGMVFVYQDDLIIVNEDFEEHIQTLSIVADRLKKANLSINFAKSGFCLRSMRYMGYIVDELGLRPDPEKVSCVLKVPLPKTVTELRRFVGMASWYRRFIKDFAVLAAPLHDLIKGGGKGRKLIWNETASESFESLKSALVSAPLLQPPNFNKPFMIFCDASDGCIGGVLSQATDDDPKQDRPIAYVSRRLRGPEIHYSTTEKECLAVIFCVDKFLEFVEGTEFIVGTDHSALTWLFKQKDLSGRLARWVLSLQEHNMIIRHVRGKNNVVADAISRFPEISLLNICSPVVDNWYTKILEEVESGGPKSRRYKVIDNKLYYNPQQKGRRLSNWQWKLVVPEDSKEAVLKECHDDPQSAHLGVQKTIDRILDRYYWPGVSRDVKKYIKKCQTCHMSKSTNHKPYGLFGKFREIHNPWQMVSMDLLGPFPRSKAGNTSLLVMCDWFTKYPILIPLRNATAKGVVRSMETRIFHEMGIPEYVIADNGKQFALSNEFKSSLKRYGVKKLWNNCFYHPQSNFTERHNKTIGAALRSYIHDNHKEWDIHIPEISIALKTAINAITGYSPFFLNHAREYVFHGSDYKLSEASFENDNENPLNRRSKFIEKFLEIAEKIHLKMLKAYTRNKKYYDQFRSSVIFEVGEFIYLRNYVKSDASKGICKKLSPKYVPGKITSKISPVAFEISDLDGKPLGKWHIQDLKKCPNVPT